MPSVKSHESPPRTWVLLLIVMVPQLGLTLINPSNGTISADLETTISSVEATLTVYMVGYATSMFIAGTLADRFDASKVQQFGLLFFALGCLLAAASSSVVVLAVARFLQALGGTSATVLCRIIVQRRFPSSSRVGVLTSMSMVISLTPSLSPLVGGLLAEVLPWRLLFGILAAFAGVLIALTQLLLGPAMPERPTFPSPGMFGSAVREALGNRLFRWYAAAISLVWMTYFGFVNSSTTILQEFLGQSPVAYGALMAVPAGGYLLGSMLVKRATDTYRAVKMGITMGALGIVGTVVVSLTSLSQNPLAIVLAVSATLVGVGAVIPFTQAGLLDLDLSYPGVSAGMFFFLQMAAGAAFGGLLRAFPLTSVATMLMTLMVPQILVTAMVLRGPGMSNKSC